MRVQDVMTKAVASCHADASLAAVAALMWEHNCGQLPVVSDDGKVTSVITDRDICIALGTRNQRACRSQRERRHLSRGGNLPCGRRSARRTEDHGRGASAPPAGGRPRGSPGGHPVTGRRHPAGAASRRHRPASRYLRRRDAHAAGDLSPRLALRRSLAGGGMTPREGVCLEP